MFDKKIKLELQEVKKELEKTQNKLQETQNFLDMFRSTKNAKQLIEETKQEYQTQADTNRIKLLEQTINNINYRDYITKTQKGRICIDIQQIPLEDEEIKELIK